MGNSCLFRYECNWDTTEVPPLPNRIRILSCYHSRVSSLPTPLPFALRELYCGDTLISALPPLPPSLQILSCWNTRLTELPALPPHLKRLSCSSTGILHLPSLPASLHTLECCKCHDLMDLPPLPAGLQELNCSFTLIRKLPPLPETLCDLNCSYTQVKTLPPLPPRLYEFNLRSTGIRVLPPLPNTLQILKCSDSLLTELPDLPVLMDMLECQNMVNFPISLQVKHYELLGYWRTDINPREYVYAWSRIRKYSNRWAVWRDEQRQKRLAAAVAAAFTAGILEPAFVHRRIRQAAIRLLTDELGRVPTEAEIADRPMPVEFFERALLNFDADTTTAISEGFERRLQKCGAPPVSVVAAVPELKNPAHVKQILQEAVVYERILYDVQDPVMPYFTMGSKEWNNYYSEYSRKHHKFENSYCNALKGLDD